MADFEQLRNDLSKGRNERDNARQDLNSTAYQLRYLKQQREALERQKGDNNPTYLKRRAALDEQIAAVNNTYKSLQERFKGISGQLLELENAFELFIDPRRELTAHFSNQTPFLLFPLRMETRFKTVDNVAQLWIRVYPDECLVDSFEPLLSEKEVNNAARFWAEYYSAGTSADPDNPDPAVLNLQKAAWALLVGAAGDGRAAWITRQLKPDETKSVFPLRTEDAVILAIATDNWDAATQPAIFDLFTKLWYASGNDALSTQIKDQFNTANPALNADTVINTYRPVNFDDQLPINIKKREDADVKIAVAVFTDLADKAGKAHGWSQASRVNLLPERLALIRYKNNAAMDPVFGRTIPATLATSPDPSEDAEKQFEQNEAFDMEFAEEIKWVADFDKAVSIGMGFRINLAPDEVNGFQRLIVLGVRLGSDAATGKQQLETLFDHHYFSKKGFTFLPQGTPTNNTGSSGSGYTGTEDPDKTFDLYFKGKDGFTETPDANLKRDGQWMAEWLGLDYATFKKVLYSGHKDQADARNMNIALWPGTMGYVLDALMQGGFTGETQLNTRTFFNSYVSGRGAVPAIRIGNQPYGILPVTPFQRLEWLNPQTPVPGIAVINQSFPLFLRGLYQLLLQLHARWRDDMLNQVPFVAKATSQPYQELLDIIGLHPNSVEFHRRYMESLIEMKNKVSIINPAFQFNSDVVSDAVNLLQSLKYPTEILPQVAALLGLPWEAAILQLIDDQPLSEEKGIRAYTADHKNYIAALVAQASKSLNAIRTGEGLSERPAAELYRLLKYALELAYHKSAVDAAEEKKVFNPQQIIAMRTEQPFMHQQWKDTVVESRYALLYDTVPQISPNRTVSEYIRDSIFQEEIPFHSRYLASQLKALENLSDASTARLERAFVEHLDNCHYRLDAWKNGLLTLGLSDMRNNQPGAHYDNRSTGIFLGAFGWLENVKPEKNKVLTPKQIPEELKEDFNKNGDKVFVTDAANEGYIHTPSLNQGVTAAVLRNGYISHGKPDANNVLAVNLSSERIRLALSVIEGIQGGQPLPALLGYHFERTLHNRSDLTAKKIDSFIYAIRRIFPLNADQLKDTRVANTNDPSVDPDTVPITAIEARNVVHGSNLVKHVKQQTGGNQQYPFNLDLPDGEAVIKTAITETVLQIIDIADAIADLGIAESVHHVVMGNTERAAGVLESYSKGNYPQEPDVIRTPRSGPTLTHRVSIPFTYVATNAGAAPRALSEPSVNQWLTSILPPLNKIVCQCAYFSRADGAEKKLEISLQAIGLDPLDLLYMLNALDTQSLNELDDRLIFFIHTTADPIIDSAITFNYIEEPADTTKLSVFQVMPLVKSLRALIVESSPLTPGDVALPNEVDKKDLPAPELSAQRVVGLRDKLNADLAAAKSAAGIIKALQDLPAFDTLTDPQAETIRQQADTTMQRFAAFLLVLGSYGLPQTSIGGIYAQQQRWYVSLKTKVKDLWDRWEQKATDYTNLLTANPVPTEEVLLNLERLISSTTTTGVTLLAVKNKKTLFDTELSKLTNILSTRFNTVFDLLQAIRNVNTVPFDNVTLDISDELRQIPVFIYDLQARAASLLTELETKKIPAVNDILGDLSTLSQADQPRQIEAAARIILGDQFKMFPRYALPPSQQTEISNSWNDTNTLLNHLTTTAGYLNPVEDWLHGMARVHDKMKHLENCILVREAFGMAEGDMVLHPVQLPYLTEKYHWLAMPFPQAEVDMEAQNILLYTAYTPALAPAPNEVCGALADEWTEIIPATEETTGITFHYDRPNCEAPQTLLLVTPSRHTGNWDWNDLVDSLTHTLESAKLRAVGPEQFKDTPFATLLPAVIAVESLYPYSIVLDNKLHYTTIA